MNVLIIKTPSKKYEKNISKLTKNKKERKNNGCLYIIPKKNKNL